MRFYDTNGPGVNLCLIKKALEQVNLGWAVGMRDRLRVAALVRHNIPYNAVDVIVFCHSI